MTSLSIELLSCDALTPVVADAAAPCWMTEAQPTPNSVVRSVVAIGYSWVVVHFKAKTLLTDRLSIRNVSRTPWPYCCVRVIRFFRRRHRVLYRLSLSVTDAFFSRGCPRKNSFANMVTTSRFLPIRRGPNAHHARPFFASPPTPFRPHPLVRQIAKEYDIEYHHSNLRCPACAIHPAFKAESHVDL